MSEGKRKQQIDSWTGAADAVRADCGEGRDELEGNALKFTGQSTFKSSPMVVSSLQ